jgi:hypothetical protein
MGTVVIIIKLSNLQPMDRSPELAHDKNLQA